MRRFIRRALIEVWLHCPDCCTTGLACPNCGAWCDLAWPQPPSHFPLAVEARCEVCNTQLVIAAVGWEPNPTGEHPPVLGALNDSLQRLERAWQRPSC
jgi:hypothetical protein